MKHLNFLGNKKAIFLIGAAGAGKTELALNLSVWNAANYENPVLVDLDIVNPFFRVRKLRKEIEKKGIKVITPIKRVVNGILPAIPQGVWGAVSTESNTVVCDVGGGETGLRLLGRMKELAANRKASVLFVMNPFRPDFTTPKELKASFELITRLSALEATQIIINPSLSNETSLENFNTGIAQITEFAKSINIPIGFAMAASELASQLSPETEFPTFFKYNGYQTFGFNRYWNNPWEFGIKTETL